MREILGSIRRLMTASLDDPAPRPRRATPDALVPPPPPSDGREIAAPMDDWPDDPEIDVDALAEELLREATALADRGEQRETPAPPRPEAPPAPRPAAESGSREEVWGELDALLSFAQAALDGGGAPPPPEEDPEADAAEARSATPQAGAFDPMALRRRVEQEAWERVPPPPPSDHEAREFGGAPEPEPEEAEEPVAEAPAPTPEIMAETPPPRPEPEPPVAPAPPTTAPEALRAAMAAARFAPAPAPVAEARPERISSEPAPSAPPISAEKPVAPDPAPTTVAAPAPATVEPQRPEAVAPESPAPAPIAPAAPAPESVPAPEPASAAPPRRAPEELAPEDDFRNGPSPAARDSLRKIRELVHKRVEERLARQEFTYTGAEPHSKIKSMIGWRQPIPGARREETPPDPEPAPPPAERAGDKVPAPPPVERAADRAPSPPTPEPPAKPAAPEIPTPPPAPAATPSALALQALDSEDAVADAVEPPARLGEADALRPVLADVLRQHLPELIEEMVRSEVRRLSGSDEDPDKGEV